MIKRNSFILFLWLFLLPASCTRFENELPEKREETIRIGTYNLQNLFDEFDDPDHEDGEKPPEQRLRALADVITRINCDVLAVQEVENIEVLKSFNHLYLADMYPHLVLVEGNDKRGIDVAVLSKIPIVKVASYRDFIIPCSSLDAPVRFSRDLLAVSWYSPQGSLWTLLVTHLKSGRTLEDRHLRSCQIKALADICKDEGYVDPWGKGLVILAGDLNAAPDDPDIKPLRMVPFSDPARDLPRRSTHRSGLTLDYILLSPEADARYIVGSVKVFREFPAGIASDHFPLFLDLKFY